MRYGIIIIIAGLLAAPQLIAGKNKSAEDFLKSIAPYQGWLGVVLLVWGIYDLISLLGMLDVLSAISTVWLITIIAIVAMEIILGLLLGYNLVQKHVLSKNAAAAERAAVMHKKLAAKQSFFGMLGIIVGIWTVIADLAIW